MAIIKFFLDDLDGSNGFRIDEVAQDYRFGNSVSNAGDMNGDGFDDFIIGAFGGPRGEPYSGYDYISGSSYVVFGKASGFDATVDLSDLDGSNGFRLDKRGLYDFFGVSVSTAGDVNGDGFDDVIVGGLESVSNRVGFGSSYVVYGKASGFDATVDLSDLDGSDGFRLDGEEKIGRLNTSVSNAGDVNGDGFDDVIVSGGYYADSNELNSGSSYIVFGKASGIDATVDLSDLDGNDGFRLDGEERYDRAGSAVSTAGDVNGDGFDDVIVGAFGADSNGSNSGSSYVVFGKASGFDAAMNLSALDGSNGFRLDGEVGSRSGSSVSPAGDVNGDGFDDLIIGVPYAAPNGYNSGSSYVVFGKSSDFDATMRLSDLDGSNGFRLDGEMSHERLGRDVSAAGDVNGDGFDDVIIAVSGSSSTYLVFGQATGFDGSVNLMTLMRKSSAYFGTVSSVSGAGDVNGDGFDDLMIGVPGGLAVDQYGYFRDTPSITYVVFGSSDFGGDQVDFPGTPGDDIFTGTKAAESFEGGDGNDRMIGRGGADSFDSGAGNDYIRILGDDFQFVDGGLGTDILGLAGSGYNLDLSNVIDNIHGIETIALYGVGDNMVTLTAQDVIDLSQETNTLKIKGNAGDRVVGLSSGWTDGGVHGNFHTYTQGEAVLLIGVDVTTDFPIA
ncbi:integrin alpha [Nitrosomonas ureae]|uniref:FG-GAP repeat-containing protein n=1 Tax=Nitrosomonas ureae TaxID=44577 RepID=A0A1H2DT75_9PROT|nr:integrin alpha [Nitrosomonas ureae]ALQ50858.1 hypothetical protein ATY38_06210 [Nitrosomonas ureae]SDT85628.1 FG-GAP repeat-containing protein [Nitrosomonas ureae]